MKVEIKFFATRSDAETYLVHCRNIRRIQERLLVATCMLLLAYLFCKLTGWL